MKLAIPVVVALLLAGCSGGAAPVGVVVADLPTGWVAIALDHPEAREMFDDLKMTSNPGYADPVAAELEEMNATKLYVGTYGPDAYADGGVISFTVTFRTAVDASNFLGDSFFCEFETHVYQQGLNVIMIDEEGDEAAADEVANNFEARTGLKTVC